MGHREDKVVWLLTIWKRLGKVFKWEWRSVHHIINIFPARLRLKLGNGRRSTNDCSASDFKGFLALTSNQTLQPSTMNENGYNESE